MAAKSSYFLKGSNILAFVLTVIMNGLAGSTTLLGGKVTGEISDLYPTLITPAGYTFAIWSVIYVLLGVFVIYQALTPERSGSFHKRIGWLFVLSSALNILWLFAWQYEYLSVSVVLMLLLLATLILIYVRLGIGRAKVKIGERLAVHLPFSVYLGWITIATIANVSVMLVSLEWGGLGISPETWAVVVILVALLIAVLVAVTRKDVAYELVIIWALVGIAVNQSSNLTIAALTLACAVAVAIATVVSVLYSRRRRPSGVSPS